MVDVSVQILRCDLHPPEYHYILYDIKTFWCKGKRIVGDEGEKLKPVSLPVLPLNDYHSALKKGEDINVVIGVSYCHNDDVTNPKKCDKFVGLAMTTLNSQIENPHLNPKLLLLPIKNIINNTTEGKLYVKISACLLGAHVNGGGDRKENISSYFSAPDQTRSNRALDSPPNLEDHDSTGFFNEEEFFSDADDNSAYVESVKSDKHWLASAAHNSPDGHQSGDEKRYEELLFEYTPPRKPDPIVAHNMSCSPDFPFKIPAVEENEKQKRRSIFETSGSNITFPGSSPPYSYSPKKIKSNLTAVLH